MTAIHKTIKRLVAGMLLAGLLFSFSAHAYFSPYLIMAASVISLEQAASQVKKETGGRVLSAKTIEKNGSTLYQIKVMISPGHVQVINIDPATGRKVSSGSRK